MREFIVSEDFHPEVKYYQDLIRCKDCKFKRKLLFPLSTGETIECSGRYHKPDWFCADGEREEGDME